MIHTLALSHHWKLHQLDVNNAFLNGLHQETIYMQQPPDFSSQDKSLVCKPDKALYGLKQAPGQWFGRLQSTLLQYGFHTSK